MKYKGIIFDFNGVILWDTQWHIEAWLKVAKEAGVGLTEKEIENDFGKTGVEIFKSLLGEELSEAEAQKWTEKKEEIYREIAASKGKLFSLSPGCEELFNLIKARNIPTNIATASIKSNLQFFIDNLHLGKWFDIDKIIYDNGDLPGKPSPVMYQRATKKINLQARDCLIVEDSTMGLASANNAGAGKLIALGPKEKTKKLEQVVGVKKVITQLNEITIEDFQ